MEEIVIYTDGASQIHKGRVGGWAAILRYKGEQREVYGGEKNTTNNRMEVMACIKALETIKTTHIPIKIYSDSSYVIDTFRKKRIWKWEMNDWLIEGKQRKNVDLWKRLADLVNEQDDVEFIKVKGHSGDHLNELADSLANIGLEQTLDEKRN